MDAQLAVLFDGLIRLQLDDSSADRPNVEVVYPHPDSNGEQTFPMEMLAHEERMLIYLYSLVHLGVRPGRVMYVDAPQAALDSADIKRWLDLFLRRSEAAEVQALVAVNETSLLESLPPFTVVWRFTRAKGGPARVSRPGESST